MITSVFDIAPRVEAVWDARLDGDERRAHAIEHDLYEDVLKAIARGQGRHVALARAALQTIRMPRRVEP